MTNHQTDLPGIAKDGKVVAAIEATGAASDGVNAHYYRGDARSVEFLRPESVHLVVTSPPYWT